MEQEPNLDLNRIAKALEESIQRMSTIQNRGNSYYPYYKEKYALRIKTILDHIRETGEPMLIPVGDSSFNTLRNMFNQALKFLMENMDEDGKYHELRTKLKVSENKNRGITISPRREKDILTGYPIKEWKEDFLNFLENAEPRDAFKRIGIPINLEDISWIEKQLEPLENKFITDLSVNAIIVVRI